MRTRQGRKSGPPPRVQSYSELPIHGRPPHREGAGADALAEGEGFEPPVAFATTVFKTVALGRSASPPTPIF